MSSISVIILAGGKSTRMGQDKAFLEWQGQSFIQHLLSAILPLTTNIIISGDNKKLSALSHKVVTDEIKNAGPVVALASCFKNIDTENVLVLSCDVPQISTHYLEILREAHNKNFDVTFYSSNGKAMPLVGIYNKSCFPVFIAEMQKGERKLFNVINKLKVQEIEYKGGLQNVNTPQDLKLLA